VVMVLVLAVVGRSEVTGAALLCTQRFGAVYQAQSLFWFVMPAVCRPRLLQALLRPGRIDAIVSVGVPSPVDCADILRLHSSRMPLFAAPPPAAPANPPATAAAAATAAVGAGTSDQSVDLELVAREAHAGGCSGADLRLVCQEAALGALREDVGAQWVCARHFQSALRLVVGGGVGGV
jgi:SpoVK/Ycf46/Vps4 family AAA+-type ATPase